MNSVSLSFAGDSTSTLKMTSGPRRMGSATVVYGGYGDKRPAWSLLTTRREGR